MKKILLSAAILILMSGFLMVGNAMALSINFKGDYTLTSVEGTDENIQETITFINGDVSSPPPGFEVDPFFSDDVKESVEIAPLTLDESDLYNFTGMPIKEGFKLYSGSTLLLVADLSLDSLVIDGATGRVNPNLNGSLYGIYATDAYVANSSIIIESFLNSFDPGGAITLTLQLEENFISAINNSTGTWGSYSATAVPTPEPGTLLLLGSGLAGLAAARRRKKA